MGYFRSSLKQSGGGDYSATYTATVNGEIQKGVAIYKYANNSIFNSPVTIGNNIHNISYMLSNCKNYNQPLVIPNGVTSVRGLFSNCGSFNSNVVFSESIIDAYLLFRYCNNLNQNIKLPNNIQNCVGMFSFCNNFNQNVAIPTEAINISYMFSQTLYNYNVQIPNKVTDASQLFVGCTNMNCDITIPSSVENISLLLSKYILDVNAPNMIFARNIFIKSGFIFREINVRNMFDGCNNLARKNIWFNQILNNQFNKTNAFSVVGRTITWTSATNYFYNTAYNIYCYYNYEG